MKNYFLLCALAAFGVSSLAAAPYTNRRKLAHYAALAALGELAVRGKASHLGQLGTNLKRGYSWARHGTNRLDDLKKAPAAVGRHLKRNWLKYALLAALAAAARSNRGQDYLNMRHAGLLPKWHRPAPPVPARTVYLRRTLREMLQRNFPEYYPSNDWLYPSSDHRVSIVINGAVPKEPLGYRVASNMFDSNSFACWGIHTDHPELFSHDMKSKMRNNDYGFLYNAEKKEVQHWEAVVESDDVDKGTVKPTFSLNHPRAVTVAQTDS